MPINKELLLEQYRQCNEHLRESDRKKDTVLGFYATVTAVVYTIAAQNSTVFSASQGMANSYFLLVVLVMGLLGVPIGFIFTLYRGWHGVYVIQAILIQELLHKDKNIIDSDSVQKVNFGFQIVTSIEFFMFSILHILVYVNGVVGIILAEKSQQYELLAWIILILIFIEFVSHFFAMWHLDKLKNAGKLGAKYLWILQGVLNDLPDRTRRHANHPRTLTGFRK